MDFVVGLPKSSHGYDIIWVIVVYLMNLALFLPIKLPKAMGSLAQKYVKDIVKLHNAPKIIKFN